MDLKNIDKLEENDKIDGFFILKTFDKKTSSNGKEYYDLDLIDKTGEINGKIWESEKGEGLAKHNFVKVRGEVLLWKGIKQLKIHKIRVVKDSDNVVIEDYVQSAPYSSANMLNEIKKDYIDIMINEDIKKLVNIMIEERHEKLVYYPAAKENHHSIRGGLLYHILRMLRSGSKLLEVYDGMNRDILYAGIILHDLAKIEEMEANNLGIVDDYTTEGKLLGHIIQGIKQIDKVSRENEIDEEISLLIQHMVLSHHYYPEYGSPRFPMIPEGEILHYLDIIDARIYDMEKNLREIENGEFTSRIWTLDNRQLYKKKEEKL